MGGCGLDLFGSKKVSGGGVLRTQWWNLGFHKMRGIPWQV